LWAAGVKASHLGNKLAESADIELDRAGRVIVESDCSVPGHPEVFVIGDLAHFENGKGESLPPVATVAMQQGEFVGRAIRNRIEGRSVKPFRYKDRGSMAVIGRKAAVANLNVLRLSGYPAWLLWLFVHLMYLVGFENRLVVFVQWAYNYFTKNRGARLITLHGPRRE
jgi:NADH dehydrogenase